MHSVSYILAAQDLPQQAPFIAASQPINPVLVLASTVVHDSSTVITLAGLALFASLLLRGSGPMIKTGVKAAALALAGCIIIAASLDIDATEAVAADPVVLQALARIALVAFIAGMLRDLARIAADYLAAKRGRRAPNAQEG